MKEVMHTIFQCSRNNTDWIDYESCSVPLDERAINEAMSALLQMYPNHNWRAIRRVTVTVVTETVIG